MVILPFRNRHFTGNDQYTKLLLHFDGADEATTTLDSSSSAHAMTMDGNAQLDTAQSKFGGSSLKLDGNADYIYALDHADWNFGAGDFTIDFQIRFAALPASGATHNIVGQLVDANNYWYIQVKELSGSYRLIMIFYSLGSPVADYMKTSLSLSADTWYHMAFERSGATGYIFLDGVDQSATETTAFGTGTMPDYTSYLWIGSIGATNCPNGWIDELRISKGIARWTANFTSPLYAYR